MAKLEKEIETKKLEKMKLEVIKTCQYEKYAEIMEIEPKFRKIMGWITEGDKITVTPELAGEMIGAGLAIKSE